jgi:hypothetical protein
MMSRIRIKNFGPIKEGYQNEDGWIEISKVTVLRVIKVLEKVPSLN